MNVRSQRRHFFLRYLVASDFVWIFLLAGCGVGSQTPTTVPLPIALERPRVDTLPSGLRVFTLAHADAPIAALQLWIPCGHNVGKSAMDLWRELTLRGIQKDPVAVGTLERTQAQLASVTTMDHTVFQMIVPSRNVDQSMALLADVLKARPAPSQNEITTATTAVTSALTPEIIDLRTLLPAAFPETEYAALVDGKKTGPIEPPAHCFDVRTMHLVIVGQFRLQDVLWAAGSAFVAPAQGSLSPTTSTKAPDRSTPANRVQIAHASRSKSRLTLGFTLPELNAHAFATLQVLTSLLADGPVARINRQLGRRFAHFEPARTLLFQGPTANLLLLTLEVSAEQEPDAAAIALHEILALRNQPPAEEEILRAKRIALQRLFDQLARPELLARELGAAIAVNLSADFYRDYAATLPTVTAQDIQRFVDHWPTASDVVVSASVAQTPKRPDLRDVLESRIDQSIAEHYAGTLSAGCLVSGQLCQTSPAAGVELITFVKPWASRVKIRATWRIHDGKPNTAKVRALNRLSSGLVQRAVDSAYSSFGAEIPHVQASTDERSFTVEVTVAQDFWWEGLNVLADLASVGNIQRRLEHGDLEPARREALARQGSELNDTLSRLQASITAQLFADTNDDTVSDETAFLQAASASDVLTHFRDTIVDRPITLVVVGRIVPDDIARAAQRLFSGRPHLDAETPPHSETVAATAIPASITHVSVAASDHSYALIGTRGPAIDSADFASFVIVRELLRNASDSGTQHGGVIFHADCHRSAAIVYATSSTTLGDDAIRKLEEQITQVGQGDRALERLDFVKAKAIANFELALGDADWVGEQLARATRCGMPLRSLTDLRDEIGRVTLDNIRDVRERYFGDTQRLRVIAEPKH